MSGPTQLLAMLGVVIIAARLWLVVYIHHAGKTILIDHRSMKPRLFSSQLMIEFDSLFT